jgi:transmembrane sensor
MSVQEQIDRLIVHRASEWLEVLRAGRADEYPAFVEWINESPRHLDEFLQLLALSREARDMMQGSCRDDLAVAARTTSHVIELRPVPAQAPGFPLRRRLSWPAMLATAAVCVVVLGFWLMSNLSPWKRYESPAGQEQTLSLADGSVVTISGGSTILVAMGERSREIRLTEGRAFFRVAHDAHRTFEVHTRDAVVQAVGTQFDVATRKDGTRVAVVEGRVRVLAAEYSPGLSSGLTRPHRESATQLDAGDVAQVSTAGTGWRSRSVLESDRGATAKRRRLVFERTPLEEAVGEFNQYQTTTKLRVEGVPEGAYHYSGTFDADDLTSFVDTLSHDEGLSIERRAGEVIIRARN